MMCISPSDIACLVTAAATVGTLIYTYLNTAMIQRQKNELELHNIAFDIMRKGAKINEYIDGKFKYYVVRKALWHRINNVIIPECKYTKDSNGNPTNLLVYNEKKKTYNFEEENMKSFNKVNDFIRKHADGVEGLEKIPAQIIDFEEAVSLFKENIDYRFSRYNRIKFFLQKYVDSLNKFKNYYEEPVKKLNPIQCINDFAKAIQTDDKGKTDVPETAKRINEYIFGLIDSKSQDLDDFKDSVNNAYGNLKKAFKIFLEQSERKRKKPFEPNNEENSSENPPSSENPSSSENQEMYN